MSADPAGPRHHRAHGRRQVRGLLPRPRRRAARPGRLRASPRSACRPAPASPARRPPTRSCCPTTTSTPCAPRSPSAAPTIACVITEAAAGNMGAIAPRRRASTPGSREICHAHGALLVVDEVMTGFRVSALGLVRPRRRGGRPLHLRQGHVGRAARGGVRRVGRAHGAPRPGRARLPGGDAVREPRRGRRGARHAAGRRRRRLRDAGRERRPARRHDRRRAGGRGRAAPGPVRGQHAVGVLHRRRGARLRGRAGRRRRGGSRRSSTRCSTAACTRRRARSRRGSSRPRSTTTRWRRSTTRCRRRQGRRHGALADGPAQ